jgi:alkylated DNA repair dioxygenase AlkB
MAPVELLGGGCSARYWPGAFEPEEAQRLLAALATEPAWCQQQVVIAGRPVAPPRLTCWQGDPSRVYRYSGLTLEPDPWSPSVERVRSRVEALAGTEFNSVLLNLYRDGGDGMGWHSDDEPSLGANPVIGSATFGAGRRFVLRRRDDHLRRVELEPGHGSVLVMSGGTQHEWQHHVPKTRQQLGARINLTFRTLL